MLALIAPRYRSDQNKIDLIFSGASAFVAATHVGNMLERICRCNHVLSGVPLSKVYTRELELCMLLNWLQDFFLLRCSWSGGLFRGVPRSVYWEEEELVSRSCRSRQDEFRAGRMFARASLLRLGCAPTAILINPGRDPAWPQGFRGSITHSGDLALAVAAAQSTCLGIGLDLEEVGPLGPDLVRLVCSDEETQTAEKLGMGAGDYAKLCFVAKEAFYKAIFPTKRLYLDFLDVVVSFDFAKGVFTVIENLGKGDPNFSCSGMGWLFVGRLFVSAIYILPNSQDSCGESAAAVISQRDLQDFLPKAKWAINGIFSDRISYFGANSFAFAHV